MSDPFRIEVPTCISFSGGRTSAYMLWRVLQSNGGLPDIAKVMFANTGKEEESTMRFVRDCQENWNVPITWVEYRNDERGFAIVDFDTASRDGEPFEAIIRKRRFIPNPVTRFCTTSLKIDPINKYLRSIGFSEYDMMIGIRADEPRRVSRIRGKQDSSVLPLADAGCTFHDVDSFWNASPFRLNLTVQDNHTLLSNCDLCFLKGAKQIQSLIAQKPQRAMWWARMEREIGATFRSDRASYAEMAANASNQKDFYGHEEPIACFCGE